MDVIEYLIYSFAAVGALSLLVLLVGLTLLAKEQFSIRQERRNTKSPPLSILQ